MRSLYVRLALAASALTGCATAERSVGTEDASVASDSSPGIDAPPACTVMTTNLLVNPAFDATPAGTGWQQTPIDAMYPLVTDQDGVVTAESGTFRAWMGGFLVAPASNKDVLSQDVAIPAGTTALAVRGVYDLRTDESDTLVYDTATIELTTTSDTQLELIQSLDDNGATTAWTPFSKTFTGSYGGMTVRLRFSTASDQYDVTSFFFDSITLDATYCQ